MQYTVKRRVKIGSDGMLHFEMPAGSANTELEIVLTWDKARAADVDENGWPIGFFDRTYGALADDPLEEVTQLPPEQREDVE